MIPNNDPDLYAIFDGPHTAVILVAAWDDDGNALIPNRKTGKLVRASSYRTLGKFRGLETR